MPPDRYFGSDREFYLMDGYISYLRISMNPNQLTLRLSTLFVFILFFIEVQAQQARVDSIVTLLNKSNSSKVLDTVTFNTARQLISATALTDDQISQIDRATEQFKRGNNEDLVSLVRYNILISLSATDKNKAIEFGRMNLD